MQTTRPGNKEAVRISLEFSRANQSYLGAAGDWHLRVSNELHKSPKHQLCRGF